MGSMKGEEVVGDIPSSNLSSVFRNTTATKMFATIVPVILIVSMFLPLLGLPAGSSSDAAEKSIHTEAIDPLSVTFGASPSVGFVGQEITFFANATSDNPAATLDFTIYYDYYDFPFPLVNAESGFTVNSTGSPGQIVAKWTYTAVGNYSDGMGRPYFWVLMFVTDGANTVQKDISVYINYNSQPFFIINPPDPLTTSKDLETQVSIMVADYDYDSVTVHWDYGDGTWSENTTVATPEGVYVNVTHTWSPTSEPGRGGYDVDLWLNVTIWDAFNPSAEYDAIVRITLPPNVGPNLLLTASAQILDPSNSVTIFANATDYEGDPLTWMFNWSDGTVEVFHTPQSAPGALVWNNQSHVFGVVGTFPVRVNVSDALPPYQVGSHNVSTDIVITTVANSPPSGSIGVDPQFPEVNTTIGFVDVHFTVYTSDTDGDIITVVWDMGDGGPLLTNQSLGGAMLYEFNQTLRFTDEGFANISVVISDGRPGHDVFVFENVTITSTNRPPVMTGPSFSYPSGGSYAEPNVTIDFTLTINDPEGDTVQIVWDWGDNSTLVYINVTDYDENGNATVHLSHAYVKQGSYMIKINWTDNKRGILDHNGTIRSTLNVFVPPIIPPDIWSWWDYTSLGIMLSIPVLIFLRAALIAKRRRKLEERGFSYEEAKLRKEELTFRKED